MNKQQHNTATAHLAQILLLLFHSKQVIKKEEGVKRKKKFLAVGSHLQSSPGVVALDLSCSGPDMVFALGSVTGGD